jgi:uncharacterized Zn finger protein
MSEQELIRCPACDMVGGNEVDFDKRLTLRCHFCGYLDQSREDRAWTTLRQAISRYELRPDTVERLLDHVITYRKTYA